LVVAANEPGERAVAATGLALLVAVVAITGLGAAPIHGRLVERYDADLLRRLLRVDLSRTLLWSVRLVLAGWMAWTA
jgi:hypothetical protein